MNIMIETGVILGKPKHIAYICDDSLEHWKLLLCMLYADKIQQCKKPNSSNPIEDK